jgi:hypothetical protein
MVWFVAQQCDPSFQPTTVKIWVNKGDGNGLLMVPYAHPLHMKCSNTLYVLLIYVHAALDGYGASTTA